MVRTVTENSNALELGGPMALKKGMPIGGFYLAQDMTKAEGGWDGAQLIGKWVWEIECGKLS